MQHLFVLPWLTPSRRTLRGIAVVAILGVRLLRDSKKY